MANQEVDGLITELSKILERNRQQRAQTESELAKQDAQQVASGQSNGPALNASSGFAQGLKGAMGKKKSDDSAGFERDYKKVMEDREPPAAYGDAVPGRVSPYSDGGHPTAQGLSPSTGAAGRVALGQQYAHIQDLLANNPYKEQLPENPYRQTAVPDPGPASGYGGDKAYSLAQSHIPASMLSPSVTMRGRAGGQQAAPLNTPTTTGIDPAVVAAASQPHQMVRMEPAAAEPIFPTPQQPDMALLDAYQAYQRQRGGL